MDLIERQKAIEALDEQIEQCNKSFSSFDISLKDEYAVKVERASLVAFRETLEYLPPAQLGTNSAEVGTGCISREQAIDALKGCYCGGEDLCGEPWIYENQAVKAIEQLPSAQPKRGKWIDIGGNEEWYARKYRCSECGDTMLGGANFCPNCGADMREVTT